MNQSSKFLQNSGNETCGCTDVYRPTFRNSTLPLPGKRKRCKGRSTLGKPSNLFRFHPCHLIVRHQPLWNFEKLLTIKFGTDPQNPALQGTLTPYDMFVACRSLVTPSIISVAHKRAPELSRYVPSIGRPPTCLPF